MASSDISLIAFAQSLGQVFTILLLSFTLGHLNFVSPSSAKPIGTFIITLSLPALIIRSVADVDLKHISGTFLLAMIIARIIVFIAVFLVSYFTSQLSNQETATNALGSIDENLSETLIEDDTKEKEDSPLAIAALHGIFATQQNDFALGLPVISALYPGDANAKLRSYIYVFATISLILVNPIAFFIMRLGTD